MGGSKTNCIFHKVYEIYNHIYLCAVFASSNRLTSDSRWSVNVTYYDHINNIYERNRNKSTKPDIQSHIHDKHTQTHTPHRQNNTYTRTRIDRMRCERLCHKPGQRPSCWHVRISWASRCTHAVVSSVASLAASHIYQPNGKPIHKNTKKETN